MKGSRKAARNPEFLWSGPPYAQARAFRRGPCPRAALVLKSMLVAPSGSFLTLRRAPAGALAASADVEVMGDELEEEAGVLLRSSEEPCTGA